MLKRLIISLSLIIGITFLPSCTAADPWTDDYYSSADIHASKFYGDGSNLTGVSGGGLTDFANDPATTTGLTYGYKAGTCLYTFGATYEPLKIDLTAGTLTLNDNSDNYIAVNNDDGSLGVFDSFNYDYLIPIAIVTTASGAITNIVDLREKQKGFSTGNFIRTDQARQYALSDFEVTDAGGLDVSIHAGMFNWRQIDGSLLATWLATLGPITLANNSVSYISLLPDETLSIVTNYDLIPIDSIYLADVLTINGDIANITDRRAWLKAENNMVLASDTLPTPDITWRGKIYTVLGDTDVADISYICQKDATNTYIWHQIP
jgi:hypothetical protein